MSALPLFDNLTRADQIEAAWRVFHRANPRIWNLFQQFTFELLRAGHAHGSADMVCHRIRWETSVRIVSSEPVKLNNNFTPYYSRLFAHTYPRHADFFQRRRRVSEDHAAYDCDVQVNDGGPVRNEAALDVRMAELAHLATKEFHRP